MYSDVFTPECGTDLQDSQAVCEGIPVAATDRSHGVRQSRMHANGDQRRSCTQGPNFRWSNLRWPGGYASMLTRLRGLGRRPQVYWEPRKVRVCRLYLLFFIHHDTRIAGVTAKPATDWFTQQARNLCTELTEQVAGVKFLIRDLDTKFSSSFDAVFASEGIRIIEAPVRAPRTKAIAERFVGTPARVLRPHAHPRTTSHRSGTPRVRRALQPTPPAPVPRSARTVHVGRDSYPHQ